MKGMQPMTGILTGLIIAAAAGAFLLLFSATLSFSVRLLPADSSGRKNKVHGKIRLLRICGMAGLVLFAAGIFFIRTKNAEIGEKEHYQETEAVSEFADSGHATFPHEGEVFVRIGQEADDPDMTASMQEKIRRSLPDSFSGEAVLNVREPSGAGRLSDLGCRILHYNPYETIYAVRTDCPRRLYYAERDGFYCAEKDLPAIEDYFRLK